MYRLFVWMSAVVLTAGVSSAALTLVDNGQSDYSIVIPAKPPTSLRQAAQELQKDIQLASGATLKIVADDEAAGGKFISLGATQQAKAAGLSADRIPDGGFRILTRGDGLYIIGLDTAAEVELSPQRYGEMTPRPDIPGPQYTQDGGFSNGTANGVYAFLENQLGVRWLMPGEIGRDVPPRQTIRIDDIDQTESPVFIYRNLIELETWPDSNPLIHAWMNQQRLGFSFRLNHNHNWRQTVPASLYESHPDWFALIDGKRHRPTDEFDHKLETTNPELVQYFAQKAVEAFKADPHMNTFSLTPSDGRGWSQSPASQALYDPPPPGSELPSVTPLILKWYGDVSNAVKKMDPNAKLAGYLYADYLFPPKKGGMKLPENFIPMIAPSFDYGYMLYRKDTRENFRTVMTDWSKVAPGTWFYYDLPNQILSMYAYGMVTPPATEILQFIFPQLLEYHIKGVFFYGNVSWSFAALTNYIDAKLLWNPRLNALDLRNEWLARAYGAEAGAVMERFYNELDAAFGDFYRKYDYTNYSPWPETFELLFGPHYPEMEKLYLQAAARPLTNVQKQRLQLIGDNLAVLQWRLRNAGYLPADLKSPLRRTDAQVAEMLFPKENPLPFREFPVLWYDNQPERTGVEVKLASPPKEAEAKARNAGYILFYSPDGGEIQIKPSNVNPGAAFLGYRVYEQEGESFALMREGLLYTGGTIAFGAKAKTLYCLRITPHGIVPQSKAEASARYDLSIPGASFANGSYHGGALYLQAKAAPLYVYAPHELGMSHHADSSGVTLSTQSSADAARQDALRQRPQAKILLKLDEGWAFQIDPKGIGVEQGFFRIDFDDSAWKTLSAADWWQSQGFESYHGAAWYRRSFESPKPSPDQRLVLLFGAVDGDAVVYVNGRRVGEHLLGGEDRGWERPFEMDITAAMQAGRNTIAVRVTKNEYMGGIYRGVSLLTENQPR